MCRAWMFFLQSTVQALGSSESSIAYGIGKLQENDGDDGQLDQFFNTVDWRVEKES